jgi:hypothetical protein
MVGWYEMPEFKEPTGGGAIRWRFVRPGAGYRQSTGAPIQRETGSLLPGAPLQQGA